MQIEGSRVLVTGASSGIGAALAPMLAERGATLGIVARRRERLESVLAACRQHAPASRMWVADLGDLERAERIVEEAWEAFGHLDVLVNNAAIPDRTRAPAIDAERLERVMRVNFHSPARMGMVALGRMRSRGAGLIVNVSSLGGRLGIAHEAAYCASKFALCGWSEAMAIDLMEAPVDVKLVIPGPIDTGIWEVETVEAPLYDGPKVPASECAAGIVAAIESESFEFYVPDMKAIAVGKTGDVDAFLRGAAQLGRS